MEPSKVVLPWTSTLVKEDCWSVGPSIFSTLTPNIMHLFPTFHMFALLCRGLFVFFKRWFLSSFAFVFIHCQRKAFSWRLQNIRMAFYKLSPLEYKCNAFALESFRTEGILTLSSWYKHSPVSEEHLYRCRNLLKEPQTGGSWSLFFCPWDHEVCEYCLSICVLIICPQRAVNSLKENIHCEINECNYNS